MLHNSFTAELHCQYGRVGVVETPVYVHPLFSLDQDGWLCTEDQRDPASFKPVTFHFKFIKQSGDRLHYDITGEDTWQYFGSKLRKNANGWLGLYASHVVGRVVAYSTPLLYRQVFGGQEWKIQALDEWDGNFDDVEQIRFYIRDSEGHRIALAKEVYTRDKEKIHHWFLNAGNKDGELLVFTFKNIQLT